MQNSTQTLYFFQQIKKKQQAGKEWFINAEKYVIALMMNTFWLLITAISRAHANIGFCVHRLFMKYFFIYSKLSSDRSIDQEVHDWLRVRWKTQTAGISVETIQQKKYVFSPNTLSFLVHLNEALAVL